MTGYAIIASESFFFFYLELFNVYIMPKACLWHKNCCSWRPAAWWFPIALLSCSIYNIIACRVNKNKRQSYLFICNITFYSNSDFNYCQSVQLWVFFFLNVYSTSCLKWDSCFTLWDVYLYIYLTCSNNHHTHRHFFLHTYPRSSWVDHVYMLGPAIDIGWSTSSLGGYAVNMLIHPLLSLKDTEYKVHFSINWGSHILHKHKNRRTTFDLKPIAFESSFRLD